MRYILIISAIILCSCTRTVYEPVETVRTEYCDRNIHIHTTDTVNNTRVVLVKGDTVIDYREKERVHIREIHDTCFIERTDSVSVPYPVERKLSWWEQTKMDFGGVAIGATVCLLAVVIRWLIRAVRGRRG